jgi:subtilisin family serine protease
VAAIIYNNAPALFSGTLGNAATAIQAVGVSGDAGSALLGLTGQPATVTTSTGGDYAFYDGTSMAAPHVAGIAALVWSQDASCSNQDIRDVLGTTALDLGPLGRDNAFGFGLVQAEAAANGLSCSTSGGGGGSCDLAPIGDSCSADSDCCSGKCKGPRGGKTCK